MKTTQIALQESQHRKPEVYQVGDIVEILENASECGDYQYWNDGAIDMVGQSGFEIRGVRDRQEGVWYSVWSGDKSDYWPFPHYCVRRILESEGYTITPPKQPTGRRKVLPEIGKKNCYISWDGGTYCVSYAGDVGELEQFILGNMYHDGESAEHAKPEYVAWLNSTAKVLSRIAELNPEGWMATLEIAEQILAEMSEDVERMLRR